MSCRLIRFEFYVVDSSSALVGFNLVPNGVASAQLWFGSSSDSVQMIFLLFLCFQTLHIEATHLVSEPVVTDYWN